MIDWPRLANALVIVIALVVTTCAFLLLLTLLAVTLWEALT